MPDYSDMLVNPAFLLRWKLKFHYYEGPRDQDQQQRCIHIRTSKYRIRMPINFSGCHTKNKNTTNSIFILGCIKM
jgi:hypothetical protein